MAKKEPATAPKTDPAKANVINLTQGPDDDPGEVLATAVLGQNLRHGVATAAFAGKMLGASGESLAIMDCAKVIEQRTKAATTGDLSFASAMLASQAVTLDCMFTELAGRVASNLGKYPQAAELYARMAMKAQTNCRATLDTLAKLHQPREQTVRHVHVNEGGQAVIAEEFHHHAGGPGNAKVADQSHAAGPAGVSAALPCPDKGGDGVPVPGGERKATLPNARRD